MTPISSITEGLAQTQPQIRPKDLAATERPADENRAASEQRTEPDPTSTATDPVTDREEMAKLTDQMQKAIDGTAAAPHSVTFRQDKEGHGFIIELRDPDGEVIKQFPSEKVLNLRANLDELTGMVIDALT